MTSVARNELFYGNLLQDLLVQLVSLAPPTIVGHKVNKGRGWRTAKFFSCSKINNKSLIKRQITGPTQTQITLKKSFNVPFDLFNLLSKMRKLPALFCKLLESVDLNFFRHNALLFAAFDIGFAVLAALSGVR